MGGSTVAGVVRIGRDGGRRCKLRLCRGFYDRDRVRMRIWIFRRMCWLKMLALYVCVGGSWGWGEVRFRPVPLKWTIESSSARSLTSPRFDSYCSSISTVKSK